MDRLSLYNESLMLCGERNLLALTDAVESRRLLDRVWDNNAILRCLEAGQWQFATRTVQLDYTSSVEPTFGFRRAFEKPTDFVRVAAVCSDEWFKQPLLQYTEEAGFWFADLDTIYVKYVSDDTEYGGDLSLWPGSFGAYVAAHFAAEIIQRLTQDKQLRADVVALKKRRLSEALSTDAMAEPTKMLPPGSWSTARRGHSRHDGGSRNALIDS